MKRTTLVLFAVLNAALALTIVACAAPTTVQPRASATSTPSSTQTPVPPMPSPAPTLTPTPTTQLPPATVWLVKFNANCLTGLYAWDVYTFEEPELTKDSGAIVAKMTAGWKREDRARSIVIGQPAIEYQPAQKFVITAKDCVINTKDVPNNLGLQKP